MSLPASDPIAALDPVIKHTTVKYLDRPRAAPFVKWAGGKRSLVPEIVKVLPETFGEYWEPFVGGGAVFFALDSRIRRAHLSDSNLDLMIAYRMVTTRTEDLIDALHEHAEKHNRRHYKRVRDKMHAEQDEVQLAARLIYLNKTCFNGLYRVNKAGRFNVPIGRQSNPTICDVNNLRAASEVLQKATISVYGFNDEEIAPAAGDLIYCDPPYDGVYTGYTGNGFTAADQTALRDRCVQWRDAGAHVIASNNDTEFIRRLYSTFTVNEVSAPRNINSDANGRGKTSELLIVG